MSTLDLPTAKDIFEFVKAHLLKQRARSYDGNFCLYRSGEMRCAVGCLINDDHYVPALEGHNSYERSVTLAIEKTIGRELLGTERSMLDDLQGIHDHSVCSEWAQELDKLEHETFSEGN